MTDDTNSRRRPSLLMLFTGLLALIVSGWALIGPAGWGNLPAFPIGWAAVATAIVVGLWLVVSPRDRRRRKEPDM